MKIKSWMSAWWRLAVPGTAVQIAALFGCAGSATQASADLVSSNPNSISCAQYTKNGERIVLGIPNELMPGGVINDGGSAFYLNMGVDLRDFSSASSVPGPDRNLARPDWSIEKFGFNPDLDIVSGPSQPPYRNLALAGKLPRIPTDLPEFRRFDTCSGCGTEMYLLEADPKLLAMRCYVPVDSRLTGCIVYQSEGDMSLSFIVPYSRRHELKFFMARIAALLSSFQELGRDHCHEGIK
jgi:hypothetical protein